MRAIAGRVGLSVLVAHTSTKLRRGDLSIGMPGASVARVEATLGFALSERNNHAISALVFLISVLGPQRRLCGLLLEVPDVQCVPNGSYAQQSLANQRVAVQTLQWLQSVRDDLPPGVRRSIVEAIARSRDVLAHCSDPVNCWLPNCGANDGALLFDLDVADYRDDRPLLASLGCADVAGGRESAIWFSLPEVDARHTVQAEQPRTSVTLRGPGSLLLSRIGTEDRRPGQDDQLAADVWIDGHNVVVDPGSYCCTAPSPWGNALTGIETHATLREVDETVAKVGRFLRMTMPDGRVASRRMLAGDVEVVVVECEAGLGRLRRSLVCAGTAPSLSTRRWALMSRCGRTSTFLRASRCGFCLRAVRPPRPMSTAIRQAAGSRPGMALVCRVRRPS